MADLEVLQLDRFWKTRHGMLKDRGYVLCPLDCPGCRKVSDACVADKLPGYTDSLPEPHTLDRLISVPHTARATRACDGKLVVVQALGNQVSGLGSLTKVINRLHTTELKWQPYNRCVQILDMFLEPQSPDSEAGQANERWIVVVPFLRPIPSGTMKRVRDVVTFVNQVLLGIDFMHRYSIGHRDCSLHNIVTSFGVNDLHHLHREELEWSATPHHRATYSIPPNLPETTNDATSPSPAQYYLTGMDYWILMGWGTARWGGFWTSGYCSRDLSPPEYDETQFRNGMSGALPPDWVHRQTYNPFWLDVFLVGTMLKRDFIERYSNVDFLKPLVENMTNHLPEDRLSSEECIKEWSTLLCKVSTCSLKRRLRPRDTRVKRLVLKIAGSPLVRMFSDKWKHIRGRRREAPPQAHWPIAGRGLF